MNEETAIEQVHRTVLDLPEDQLTPGQLEDKRQHSIAARRLSGFPIPSHTRATTVRKTVVVRPDYIDPDGRFSANGQKKL